MASREMLWERIQKGEREAFEEFYRKNFPKLRSYLTVHLGSRTFAEDIAQEAFLQLWKHPDGFDPSLSGLRTYLFTIARRRAVDWWRSHSSSSENVFPSPQAQAEKRILMEDMLGRLDPESRSILWLREAEGYSYQELAAIFEVPVGTVKSRLFNARQHLREIWRQR